MRDSKTKDEILVMTNCKPMTDHWSDCIVNPTLSFWARAWLKTQPDRETAWQMCNQGDWMLCLLGWLAGEPESESRRKLVLCVCACVRPVLKCVPAGEASQAVDIAERWARRGQGVTLEQVAHAAYAAAHVAYCANYHNSCLAYVSFAAAHAAHAAHVVDAYSIACSASYTAVNAIFADFTVFSSSSYKSAFQKCADIVREHYPEWPKNLIVEKEPDHA